MQKYLAQLARQAQGRATTPVEEQRHNQALFLAGVCPGIDASVWVGSEDGGKYGYYEVRVCAETVRDVVPLLLTRH